MVLGIGTDKMVTNGGPQIHLQKAPNLSKEWGEGQTKFPARRRNYSLIPSNSINAGFSILFIDANNTALFEGNPAGDWAETSSP